MIDVLKANNNESNHNVTNNSIIEWIGDKKGIRSILCDSSGKYLCICGCNGDLSVWDIANIESSNTQPKCIKIISNILPKIKGINYAQQLIIDFDKSGNYLALSGKMDITILQTDNWNKSHVLVGGHTGVCCFYSLFTYFKINCEITFFPL